MRKILVATTNEVTKTWRCFTAQALRAPKLKTDYKNLSLGTASLSLKPPWLVAAKNAKQILESLFLFLFENKVWVDTFLVQTFASTFDATQIDFHAQGYDCSKAWRRVNWSPVFEFSFRQRQESRKIRICANSKKKSIKTIKIDNICNQLRTFTPKMFPRTDFF